MFDLARRRPRPYDVFLRGYLSEVPGMTGVPVSPEEKESFVYDFRVLEAMGRLECEYARAGNLKVGAVLIAKNMPVRSRRFEGNCYTEIKLVYIYPEYRRIGIMHDLVSSVLNRYAGLIGWEVERRNTASLRFFQRLAKEKGLVPYCQWIVINSEGLDIVTGNFIYLSPLKAMKGRKTA